MYSEESKIQFNGFKWDTKNNTLLKDPKVDLSKLRGFIVQVADSKEDAQEYLNGNKSNLNISPILAQDENQALEIIMSQGKHALSIVSLEMLEFQVGLLTELAKNNNITLERKKMFDVSKEM